MSKDRQRIQLLNKVIHSHQWDLENLKIQQHEKYEGYQKAEDERNQVGQRIAQVEDKMRQQSNSQQILSIPHMQMNRNYLAGQVQELQNKEFQSNKARVEYEHASNSVLHKHKEVRLYESVKDKKEKNLKDGERLKEFKELDELWLQKQERKND